MVIEMDQNIQKPSIRFKGFTDTWEQCELGRLISKGGSGGTPTSTNPSYYNGHIPFLSITDITNSNGFIYSTEKNITELGLINSAAWLVPKEAISLAMYASVGKVAILKENVATSQAFYNLVIDNLSTRDYIFHFLKKMEMNRAWDSLISTGTQANLNAEKVKNLRITIPANIDEQSRLGTLFNSIDSLITLHQRKYDKLVNTKMALLDKMFPKAGEVTPKLRFRGFTDAWEQCNWKEKVDILTNMVNPINGEYNNLPHIGPGNIESFTGKLLNNVKTVGEDGLISGKFQFEKDDIIYGKINPQLGKYVYAPYKGLCSADSYVLRGKNDLKQTFLYTLLQTDKFYKYSVSVSMRSGMPKINRSELSAFDFIAPTKTEQDKIGTFILSIEKLITLHQRKYEKLINIKKALLQKMFV